MDGVSGGMAMLPTIRLHVPYTALFITVSVRCSCHTTTAKLDRYSKTYVQLPGMRLHLEPLRMLLARIFPDARLALSVISAQLQPPTIQCAYRRPPAPPTGMKQLHNLGSGSAKPNAALDPFSNRPLPGYQVPAQPHSTYTITKSAI